MIYLLDTNTLIYLIKNKPPSVAQRVNALTEPVPHPKKDLPKGTLHQIRKQAGLL